MRTWIGSRGRVLKIEHQDLTTVDLFPFGRQDNGPVVGLALVVEATNQQPLLVGAEKLYGLPGHVDVVADVHGPGSEGEVLIPLLPYQPGRPV